VGGLWGGFESAGISFCPGTSQQRHTERRALLAAMPWHSPTNTPHISLTGLRLLQRLQPKIPIHYLHGRANMHLHAQHACKTAVGGIIVGYIAH